MTARVHTVSMKQGTVQHHLTSGCQRCIHRTGKACLLGGKYLSAALLAGGRAPKEVAGVAPWPASDTSASLPLAMYACLTEPYCTAGKPQSLKEATSLTVLLNRNILQTAGKAQSLELLHAVEDY